MFINSVHNRMRCSHVRDPAAAGRRGSRVLSGLGTAYAALAITLYWRGSLSQNELATADLGTWAGGTVS